jgi:two-component system, chemotaxis family, protein-glutamate methylesterase/glutaminase
MTAGIPKALFVNLPPGLRASLTTSPSGDTMPYGVRTAGNLQEALAILTEDDIFSVLIAVETAETVRDHLLREIRAGYPNIDIMTLLPEGDTSLAGQIPEDLHVRVEHHPVDITALVQQLTAQSRCRGQGFAGTLKNIQIDDLIQMCCLSMATISIRVAKDNQQGIIYIRDGEVVHAVCAGTTGEEAFYRILGWASGRFETVDDRHAGEDSINKSHEFLLMEAARRSDEAYGNETDGEKDEPLEETAEHHPERLKILLVEDSTLMAKILSSMLTATGEMDVVGIAQNGQDALEMAQSLFPDLILLDVNMPVMDGSTALKHIMIRTPCPVVVMSNIGSGSPEAVFQFLDLGAVDFMAKPVKNKDLLLQQQKIVTRIKRAAAAEIKNFRRSRSVPEQNPEGGPSPFPASPSDQLLIIATGCSAHSELTQLLSQLPNDLNLAIIILQTIPPTFIAALAEHFDRQSAFSVIPLADGAPLRTGTCYLGTPGHALRTTSTGREMVVEMPTHRHKDSGHDVSYLDLFLCSAVDCYPGSLMVAVLSGAETGNLEGLRYVQERGARIIVQDPATCMVAEPPASVVAAGLAGTIAAPEAIAEDIRIWAGNNTVE